ncbi:MAG TPA: DUF1150 family protein [Stellaceae bacterium]|nr:DUF1150 family protein [Stellaceae bacterium]
MIMLERVHALSPRDFAHLGVDEVAYVKRVVDNGVVLYAVFAADGTKMATMPDFATAAAALLQNEIEPLSVH